MYVFADFEDYRYRNEHHSPDQASQQPRFEPPSSDWYESNTVPLLLPQPTRRVPELMPERDQCLPQSSRNNDNDSIYSRLSESDQLLFKELVSPPSPPRGSDMSSTPQNTDLSIGSYLLVTWDALIHRGHILQLGTYISSTKKFSVQTILPSGCQMDVFEGSRINYKKTTLKRHVIYVQLT